MDEIEVVNSTDLDQDALVTQINQGAERNSLLREPGDKVTQYMTDSRNVITKAETKNFKATHRQYAKKDGTPGKQTITIMQPDE